MIQRLQSLYLLIVFILAIVSLCSTIALYNAGGEPVADFTNFTFNTFADPFTKIQSAGPWALGVIQIVVAALAIFTILNFNKRVMQMRITTFNIILLIGYVAAYAFYAWLYQQKLMEVKDNFEPDFQLKLTAIYPVVSIILCILAFRGTKRDEKLIRSLERIR